MGSHGPGPGHEDSLRTTDPSHKGWSYDTDRCAPGPAYGLGVTITVTSSPLLGAGKGRVEGLSIVKEIGCR
jgi:hypothetical protein